MTLHAPTLVASTIIVCFTASLLLALSWLQSQRERCLYIWSLANLVAALSAILFMMRNSRPDIVSVHAANILMLLSAGLGWAGTRAFCGRSIPWAVVATPPLVWPVVMMLTPEAQVLIARNFMSASVTAGFAFATALEFWRSRSEGLVSCIPAAALMAIHGVLNFIRLPASLMAEAPPNADPMQSAFASGVALEIMSYAVAITFLRIALVRERAEMTSRKAVMTDLLTGAASRRAFFREGERMLMRAAAQRMQCAILVADLDHFKTINDRWGHAAGDRVLQEFARRAKEAFGFRVMFARLGGEEFAALMPDVSPEDAFHLATNMLDGVSGRAFDVEQAEIPVTTSIGLAFTGRSGYDLEILLRHADTALYCAKHNGRNRIECADIASQSLPRAAA